MTLEYGRVPEFPRVGRWRRRIWLTLLITVGVAIAVISGVLCIGRYASARTSAVFEGRINAMNLVGQTPQQVIAKLGKPIEDSRGDGSYCPGADGYISYQDPWGEYCSIKIRRGVVVEVDFHGGD